MNKPILFMMCGLQASGKSTYACKLSEEYDATVFSSDALRIEMFGDVNEQSRNEELFQELRKRIKECLKSGRNAVFDATNTSSKRRRAFLQELNKIDCEKRCVIMATPYEQCIINNASRDRIVPEHVMDRTYKNWDTPYWFEGWDDIEVVYWKDTKNSMGIFEWLDSSTEYSQDNPHHTLTLGQHCLKTGYELIDEDLSSGLMRAGFIHDCGKPYTKTFTNTKGEVTEVAHYYCHENVGAYNALFYDCGIVNPLVVSVLVNLHMKPYVWEKDNNEKLHNKYRRLWGAVIYDCVMKLHEADKASH